jgi:branched-chain amino acid transport system permease protein
MSSGETEWDSGKGEGILDMTSFIIGIITVVAIYCMLVLALNMRWGYCGLLDFGVAGFFLIGAYTAAILISAPSESYVFGVRYTVGYGIAWPLGLIAAAVASGFLAFIIGIPTLRLRGDYLAIVTIGVAEILRYVAINERWLTRGVQGIRNIKRPFESFFAAASLPSDIILLVLTLAILALFLIIASRLYVSPFGRVLRAMREDEVVTSFLGKPVTNFKMHTFIVGGIYMGVAGALFAMFTTAIEPYQFIPTYTFLMWACLIVGGSGNNWGAIVGGALIMGLFVQATRFLPSIPGQPQLIPALRYIAVGILLIVVLRLRPRGLLPEKAIRIEEIE